MGDRGEGGRKRRWRGTEVRVGDRSEGEGGGQR